MYHDTCTCIHYYIYLLYNMNSVSSTGDRDIQPAAVDD